ncbi:MAG: NAD(P)/FAD-dependent oxidoreductase [Aliidongia sp.]
MIDGKSCRVETDTGPQIVRAEHVVLATGSEPMDLKTVPFGGRVISSTGALSLPEVPARLVVVGAGYIGLELGTAYAKLGSKVTIVEAEDRILPLYDAELTRPVSKRLDKLGIEILTATKAQGLSPAGDALIVQAGGGEARSIPADRILVAIGRRPRTPGFRAGAARPDHEWPVHRIDERCATSMRNVWAIGDVTGEPMLAHRAMAQGEMVAEIIAGQRRAFDKVTVPAVCFTDPEIVTAGLSPDDARKLGHELKVGLFPFTANGRAMTRRGEDGFIRIVARADNHLVLGIRRSARRSRNSRPPSAWRWRWAPGWKISPARSMPTPPWARRSRNRR